MSDKKLACITGCSRGLGRAMVGAFADAGWTVAGCARSSEAVAALAAERPPPHWFTECNVADADQVAAFCRGLLERLGPPDLLLNNAAIVNRNAPLWEVPEREFSDLIDINIKGTASMIRHLAPAMMQRGSGVIVNFSSGWGRSTSPEVAPYCATKWAIEGLSQAAAQETCGRIAIVSLNPGIIDTDMPRSCFGADAAAYPEPARWATKSVPFLMKLGLKDNGRALTAPAI